MYVNTAMCQQGKQEGIKVILKPTDQNSLILRWAPTSDKVWLQMNDGYIIFTVRKWKKGERMSQSPISFLKDTVRVWPKERFEALVNTPAENDYTMLAGYLIHSPYETLTTPEFTIKSMTDRKDELTNRFSSALYAADMNALAAEASAMRYVLKEVDLKSYYSISVHLFASSGEEYHDATLYDPEHVYEMEPIINKFEGRESAIVLSWGKKLHQAYFTAYQIERSEDGKNFYSLTEKPYLNAIDVNNEDWQASYVYIDSVENYKKYHYRLRGYDPFGDLSAPSKSVIVMALDLTPPHNVTDAKVEVMNDQHALLTWTYNDAPVDFAGFEIRKSSSYEGNYYAIATKLSKDLSAYKDQSININGNQYYKICALDTSENTLCTQPIMMIYDDKTPPSQPIGLISKSDSLGIVRLNWELGKDNDLKGYNVYFSNRIDGVFSILNTSIIRDTIFADTISLNSLSRHLYYSVVAIDLRDNMSDFSDKVQVVRYDTIPPGPAVFVDYTTNESGILIKWQPSSSRDLAKTELYRKTESNDFIKIKEFQKAEISYLDRDTKPEIKYTYQLISVDGFGLSTTSPKVLHVTSAAKSVPTVILEIQKLSAGLEISFTVDGDIGDLDKIQFYRSENNGSYRIYKEVTGFTINSWQDVNIKNGVKYSYKAIAIHKNQRKSSYSSVADITFK